MQLTLLICIPSVLPQLAAIGQNLQDHCILPLLFGCNWWMDWSIFASVSGVHLEKYPLNCVHGWINLNSNGHVITDDDTLPTFVFSVLPLFSYFIIVQQMLM